MSLSTADTIFLCVGVIDFGGIFIWFGFALHLAYTRLDEMLERLKNCQAITRCVSLGHRGLYGKILLIGGISSIVTFLELALVKASSRIHHVLSEERQVLLLESLLLLARPWLNVHGGVKASFEATGSEVLPACVGFLYC